MARPVTLRERAIPLPFNTPSLPSAAYGSEPRRFSPQLCSIDVLILLRALLGHLLGNIMARIDARTGAARSSE